MVFKKLAGHGHLPPGHDALGKMHSHESDEVSAMLTVMHQIVSMSHGLLSNFSYLKNLFIILGAKFSKSQAK